MQIEGHCVDLAYVSFISTIKFSTSWNDPPRDSSKGLQIIKAEFDYIVEGREMVVCRQFTSLRESMPSKEEIDAEIDKLQAALGPIREEMVSRWLKIENVTS